MKAKPYTIDLPLRERGHEQRQTRRTIPKARKEMEEVLLGHVGAGDTILVESSVRI